MVMVLVSDSKLLPRGSVTDKLRGSPVCPAGITKGRASVKYGDESAMRKLRSGGAGFEFDGACGESFRTTAARHHNPPFKW
jgi:hypothetical protein